MNAILHTGEKCCELSFSPSHSTLFGQILGEVKGYPKIFQFYFLYARLIDAGLYQVSSGRMFVAVVCVLGSLQVRTMSKLHACFMAAFAPPFTYFVFFLQVKAVSNLDYVFMSVSSCTAFGWMLWNFPEEGISPKSSMLLTAVAFVQGIAWMDLCADELVDVLEVGSA